MNYVVVWGPLAVNMLAEIWLNASDRRAVTEATAILEKQLGYEPLRLGESRESSVHSWVFLPPVGIDFEVIEDDKRVIVQTVFATK